jgi:trans-aconitate methyltransferase
MAAGEAWRDPAVASAFVADRAVRVPETATQLSVLAHVLRERGRPIRRIIDLGAGDGTLLGALLDAFPAAEGVALDFSPTMRQHAEGRLATFGARAVVGAADLRTPGWTDGVRGSVDVVVSGFAIHHLPDVRKRALYGEILARLEPGGTFLNLEHVASAGPRAVHLFDEAMIGFQAAARTAAGETVDVSELRTAYHARPDQADNILAPVDRQCAWLRELGFVEVDVFWKWFELAIFGGEAPCS